MVPALASYFLVIIPFIILSYYGIAISFNRIICVNEFNVGMNIIIIKNAMILTRMAFLMIILFSVTENMTALNPSWGQIAMHIAIIMEHISRYHIEIIHITETFICF